MLSETTTAIVAASPQSLVKWKLLPDEIKIVVLKQLVRDPAFFRSLFAFMRTNQKSNELAHDPQLLRAAALYWLTPQNISALSNRQIKHLQGHLPPEDFAKFEKDFEKDVKERISALPSYDANCKGLMLAAARGHAGMIKVFITALEEWDLPYYIGEALKTVATEGYLDLALILTAALLTKNKHGRDLQLQSACRLALAHQHWEIVSFLIDQPACATNSKLVNNIFHAARKANQKDLVKKLVENNSAQLGLLEKLSLLTQPRLRATDDVEKLFSNHSWLKAPLCFGLRRLGYPRQNTNVDIANTSKDECAKSLVPACSR